MVNKNGTQLLLDLMICMEQIDEKGLGRVRAPGELILDKLFGQKGYKVISLPSLATAVAAAAAAGPLLSC